MPVVLLALSLCGCGGAETVTVTTTETVTRTETRSVRTVTVTETVANLAKPSPSRLVFVPVQDRLLYKPHSIGLGLSDLTDIRWIRYGGRTALAAGIFHQRDCSKIWSGRCAKTEAVRKIPVKVKLFHQSTCRGMKVYDLYELRGSRFETTAPDVLSFDIECSRPPFTAGQRRAD